MGSLAPLIQPQELRLEAVLDLSVSAEQRTSGAGSYILSRILLVPSVCPEGRRHQGDRHIRASASVEKILGQSVVHSQMTTVTGSGRPKPEGVTSLVLFDTLVKKVSLARRGNSRL